MANSVVAAMLKQIPELVPDQPELRLPLPQETRGEPEHDIVP
jgi:hypothetical protein